MLLPDLLALHAVDLFGRTICPNYLTLNRSLEIKDGLASAVFVVVRSISFVRPRRPFSFDLV